MDRIEPRIHDEIKDYKEKFYNFTLRQWIFGILILITTVPLYLFLSPIIGSDLTGWLVIIVAIPIGFFGFIPIQGLNAEKIVFFWKRNYINFAKPLVYKTEAEIQAEKNNKKHSSGLSKQEKVLIQKKIKEDKLKQKELKKEHQRQRELARAKKKFGINNINKSSDNVSLTDEETKALLTFVKQAIGKENPIEEKREEESTQETKEE